jgi:hypothetical protein
MDKLEVALITSFFRKKASTLFTVLTLKDKEGYLPV